MAAFEDKLVALAGIDTVKAAKLLLKGNRMLGAWHGRKGELNAVFRENGQLPVETTVITGSNPVCHCSCKHDSEFCVHGIALIMYGSRFKLIKLSEETAPTYYGGLRKQNFDQLAVRGLKRTARLVLNVVQSNPHAPSRWENMTLAVRLVAASREYVGNQSNLRQLYFEKGLSVALKFDDFPLHDQQLIRFLALNGEADSSNIVLNSETAAEFFHALPGFPRFFREGHHLTVHPGRAEAILIEAGKQLSPGLRLNGAALAVAGGRVIAGKAGCWVGRDDEYFFVGGSCEVGFLRDFFRCPIQQRDLPREFPLPIVRANSFEPELRHAGVLLDAEFDAQGAMHFYYTYIYRCNGKEVLHAPHTGFLAAGEKDFWKRDQEFESNFETSLKLFGFSVADDGSEAILPDVESAGLFLDKALPELLAPLKSSVFSARFAAMVNPADGLTEAQFRCRRIATNPDSYIIGFDFGLPGMPLDWEACRERCANHGHYALASGRPLRISSDLGALLRAAPSMFRAIDPVKCTFELPFCNAAYFTAAVAGIPGALVPEVATGPQPEIPAGSGFEFTGTLRSYQSEGVDFLCRLTDRGFNPLLADEMGLGKTVQLLALLAARMRRGGAPSLIVCPASLTVNWLREAARFIPDLRVMAPRGTDRAKVLSGQAGEFDLLVLSYTAARLSLDQLKHYNFSFLILDEAQHIKNPGSENAKNCKNLRAAHRIVLTGTPLENSPEDLWSVMDFLQPGMLGTLPAFRRRYTGIQDDPELQEDLSRRISPFIKRRTKAEVATDLPQKTELLLSCDFGEEQRSLYDAVLSECRTKLQTLASDDKGAGAEIFSTLLRLRQICCHPALLPDGRGAKVPSAKLDLLMEMLHETIDSGHKVLLFSQFTSMLKLMIPQIEADGIAYEYLDGATVDRQERVDHFNNSPDIPLFLLSLKAGGTGLNLTSADTVIIYDPWWNPAVELQAADRTHRIGQEKPVQILRLAVSDSIEEKILSLQERKKELFDALVEAGPASSSISLDDLRELLG